MKKATVIKLLLLAVVIGLLIWFSSQYLDLTPATINERLEALGFLAPLFFILIYTLRPLIFFPVTILSLTGGLAFGAFYGTLYSVIGVTGGAVLSFWIARKFGKGLRRSSDIGILEKIEEQMASRGFIYVFFVRLLPFVPFDLVSYASGISRIRFRQYLIASTLGSIPLQIIYNTIGADVASGNIAGIVIAIVILLIVTTAIFLYGKKMGWYA